VPELEILIGKLLSIDRLATSSLRSVSYYLVIRVCIGMDTYVATGEVTTLEHEVGNHAVEFGARIAKALLASAESAEVLCSLGYDIVEKLEVDATLLLCEVLVTDLVWQYLGVVPVIAHGTTWNTFRCIEGHYVRLTPPLEVTLPDLSTSTSGPSQEISKYDLMVMLYAEGVKKRLLAGARIEEVLERKADRAAARRWGWACMSAMAG
jgi:hypothetical protein